MKKILAVIGIGAMTFAFMSTTCSSAAGEPADKETAIGKPAPGIHFESMTFEEAMKEAKKTGKLIFIDAYTDWCGPCKRMAATTFKDPEVAALFNKNFINIKVEMEKDKDGPELARRYRVVAYPTLLFVDGNGKLVKQSIGMKNSNQLTALANSLL